MFFCKINLDGEKKRVYLCPMLPQQKYVFVSAFNTGGLENACTCDNCGRAIVNVVTIADNIDNKFNVGEDCALTLQGIKDDFDFNFSTLPIFVALKTFNAKVRKAQKAGCVFKELYEYGPNKGAYKQGGFTVTFGNFPSQKESFWVNCPIEYMPIFAETIKRLQNEVGK